MKKRWLSVLLVAIMAFGLFSSMAPGAYASDGDIFSNPGVHVVQVPGWIGSPIISTVTVDSNRILSIDVNENETEGFGDVAINTIRNQILANQTANVSAVSGATLTSFAFISSMHEALFNQAGGDRARLMDRPPDIVFYDTTADVVVVGSGAAGFATAIRVASQRPDWTVILLEKDGILGGTSVRAGSGVTASGSQLQIRSGFYGNRLEADGGGPIQTVRDDVRAHGGTAALEGEFRDFFRLSAANSKYLVNFANEVRNWHIHYRPNSHGIIVNHRSVMDYGGFTGAIMGLQATALSHGVDIRVNNRGRQLLNTAGALAGPTCDIGGIRVETPGGTYDIRLNANNPNAAVVLATGGIAGNQELKQEFFVYAEYGVNTNVTNTMYHVTGPASARFLMGDGHVMAREVGAALDMMHALTARAQGIPGQNISGIANADLPHQDNFMSGAIPRVEGLLYISADTGRRFSNEPNEPNALFFDDDGVPVYYWGIMTHAGMFPWSSMVNWYTGGLFSVAYTAEEAANIMGLTGTARSNFIDEMRQIRHVATHNVPGVTQDEAIEAARNCNDPNCPFYGVEIRDDFPTNVANVMTSRFWSNGPFYVTSSRTVPILHGTYGGIRVNINAQVVRGTNNHHQPSTMEEAALEDVITGLYAAGTAARPPRSAAPNLQAAGSWGIAAGNHILGLPSFDNSYWE